MSCPSAAPVPPQAFGQQLKVCSRALSGSVDMCDVGKAPDTKSETGLEGDTLTGPGILVYLVLSSEDHRITVLSQLVQAPCLHIATALLHCSSSATAGSLHGPVDLSLFPGLCHSEIF